MSPSGELTVAQIYQSYGDTFMVALICKTLNCSKIFFSYESEETVYISL